jgi:hypothetical protein
MVDPTYGGAMSDTDLPELKCDYCGANHLKVPQCSELIEALATSRRKRLEYDDPWQEFFNPWPNGFTYEACTKFNMSGCTAREPEAENVTIDGNVYNNSDAPSVDPST